MNNNKWLYKLINEDKKKFGLENRGFYYYNRNLSDKKQKHFKNKLVIIIPLLFMLTACSVTPKWNRYVDKEDPFLDGFAKPAEQISFETESNDKKSNKKNNAVNNNITNRETIYYYRAYIDGLPAADASFSLTRYSNNDYLIKQEFAIIAPWTTIFNGFGRQQIKGRFKNGIFSPYEVKGTFVIRGKQVQISTRYFTNGKKPETTLQPPRNTDAITPIDAKLLARSVDINSYLLTAILQYKSKGVKVACNNNSILWDGWRLSRLNLKPEPSQMVEIKDFVKAFRNRGNKNFNPTINSDNNTMQTITMDYCSGSFDRLGGFLKKYEQENRQNTTRVFFTLHPKISMPLEISVIGPLVKPKIIMTQIDDAPISYYLLGQGGEK